VHRAHPATGNGRVRKVHNGSKNNTIVHVSCKKGPCPRNQFQHVDCCNAETNQEDRKEAYQRCINSVVFHLFTAETALGTQESHQGDLRRVGVGWSSHCVTSRLEKSFY